MRAFFALSAAAAFLLAQAQTDERTLSDNFSLFRWNGNGAFASEAYTLKLDKPARIQVTDFKNRGDVFQIYDNDQLIGETSQVEAVKDDSIFAATPEEALAMDQYSKGVFDLAAGEHRITIKANSPYEAGTAAIRFVTDKVNRNIFKKEDDNDEDCEDDDGNDKKDVKKGYKKGGSHKHEDDDNSNKGNWNKSGSDDNTNPGGWQKPDSWQQPGQGGWEKPSQDGWENPDGWQQPGQGGWEKSSQDGWENPDGWQKPGQGDWNHNGPSQNSPEYDPNHTTTITKTEWVVERPTAIPVSTAWGPSYGHHGYGKEDGGKYGGKGY